MQSAEHGRLTVPVAVVRTYQRRRPGRRQLRTLLYVCLGGGCSLVRVRRRYRRRFGIETGYRLMEQVPSCTSTPNPALRFLLMGVALLIVNMWIRLHWLFLQLRGRGPRRVARWRFRLDRMTRFLTRAVSDFMVLSPPSPWRRLNICDLLRLECGWRIKDDFSDT